MNEEIIKEKVLEALLQIVPEAAGEEIEPATAFRDQFELDSIDYVNLVLTLEKELEVTVPELDYPQLGSLNGAIAYLQVRLAGSV